MDAGHDYIGHTYIGCLDAVLPYGKPVMRHRGTGTEAQVLRHRYRGTGTEAQVQRHRY